MKPWKAYLAYAGGQTNDGVLAIGVTLEELVADLMRRIAPEVQKKLLDATENYTIMLYYDTD